MLRSAKNFWEKNLKESSKANWITAFRNTQKIFVALGNLIVMLSCWLLDCKQHVQCTLYVVPFNVCTMCTPTYKQQHIGLLIRFWSTCNFIAWILQAYTHTTQPYCQIQIFNHLHFYFISFKRLDNNTRFTVFNTAKMRWHAKWAHWLAWERKKSMNKQTSKRTNEQKNKI